MPERFAIPFRIAANGRLATVEQDSQEDVGQCVAMVLRHRPGDRWDYPQMGVDPQTFAESVDVDMVADRVSRYEVRGPATAGVDVEDMVASVAVAWQQQQEDQNG